MAKIYFLGEKPIISKILVRFLILISGKEKLLFLNEEFVWFIELFNSVKFILQIIFLFRNEFDSVSVKHIVLFSVFSLFELLEKLFKDKLLFKGLFNICETDYKNFIINFTFKFLILEKNFVFFSFIEIILKVYII